MTYDLLLAGGEVIGRGQTDVAVRDGRIAGSGPGLPRDAPSPAEIFLPWFVS